MDSATGYAGEPRPELADLDRCTRCGLCEQACPTYRVLHFEPDSPRGRVFLMKEVAEGSAAVDANLADHLYQCLGCRACETVCPAGVPFGKLLERGRYQIEQQGELSPDRRGWRRFRALAFEHVLPSPWLFQTAMLPASTLQQVSPLLRLVQSLPLPKRLAQLVRMIPRNQTTTELCTGRLENRPVIGKLPLLVANAALALGCSLVASCARSLAAFTKRRCAS